MTVRHVSLLAAALLLPLAGCHKAAITSYQVPKIEDQDPGLPGGDAASGGGMDNTAVPSAQGPSLAWTAPADWRAKPLDSVRRGSYDVPGAGGATADFSITAFPGDVGGELANVNRWRGQVQLPPVADDALASAVQTVSSHGLSFTVVDCGVAGGQRILGAMVPFQGNTWFFKLMGPDAAVEGAKPDFLAFLRTVRPTASTGAPAAPAAAAPSGMADMTVAVAQGAGLAWTAPAGWRSQPPGPMRKASYAVPGAGGTTADFSITAFPGDVGGELANVNRWRGQVQLPPVDDATLGSAVEPLTAHGLSLSVVDCGVAGGQRILGAIVPYQGNTWFFKLIGPDKLVAAAKPDFLSFLQTVRPATQP
jgi:hypothetical protein